MHAKMINLTYYFKNSVSGASDMNTSRNNGESDSDDIINKSSNTQTLKPKRKKKKVRKKTSPNLQKRGALCNEKGSSLNTSTEDFETVDHHRSKKKKTKTEKEEKKDGFKKHPRTCKVIESDCETIEKSVETTKLNAFDVMMESRTKSIGRNSPGREKTEEDKVVVNKEKLSARKSLLQTWADKKGGLKRKRIEEETEEIIKIKLENRADKFKKMLTNTKKERQIVDTDTVIVVDKETVCSIENDMLNTTEKVKIKNKKKEKTLQENCESKSPWKMKIKVSLDEGSIETPLRRSTRNKKLAKSDEEEEKKLAPIFVKKYPKPLVDPSVIEAKKNFLYSPIPEAIKKAMDKQKSMECKELEIFPKISHIQQQNNNSEYWRLPSVDFTFRKQDSPVKTEKNFNLNFNRAIEKNLDFVVTTTNLKLILKEIKNEYPEFPVYRTFRLLREKNSKFKEAMWTEKYKAQTTKDILGNNVAIKELKIWLKNWLKLTEAVSIERKRKNSSSSDFDVSDDDSRSKIGLSANTVIISGAVASGKTMAVYAIANELDINVLELNASSKRTGKRLLQELQEATQSHQVQKNTTICTDKKLSLVLIEDVDIVFEQDEGFLSSLSQLLNTSKRPVILINSNTETQNLIRFTSQYKVIKFSQVDTKILSYWLQLVCLLEGMFLRRNCIQELLEYNKKDVRKTLLQLQFWISSDCNKNTKLLESTEQSSIQCIKYENCLKSFLIEPNDTTVFWWNFKKMLQLQTIGNKKSLENVTMFLETQSYLDLMDGVTKIEKHCNFYGKKLIKDSLELKENLQSYKYDYYLNEEIQNYILKSTLNLCGTTTEKVQLNFGLPNTNQIRWYKTQQNCDKIFTQILPQYVKTDRKATTVDYLATLRDITRSEMKRFANNNKRGNRFYNYLQGLGIACNESVLKTTSEIFL